MFSLENVTMQFYIGKENLIIRSGIFVTHLRNTSSSLMRFVVTGLVATSELSHMIDYLKLIHVTQVEVRSYYVDTFYIYTSSSASFRTSSRISSKDKMFASYLYVANTNYILLIQEIKRKEKRKKSSLW